jgi:signal transduction histidine kinase
MTPDDLTRRGYDAEVRRHRENLARALDEARRTVESLSAQLHAGGGDLASETRRLLAAAGDAVQTAGALSAAEQLSFTVDQES